LDGGLGKLVEQHPMVAVHGTAQLLGYVKGDGLALPVGVGGQVYILGLARSLLELLDHLFLALDDLVFRIEVLVQVHPQAVGRKIHDMPHRGLDLKILAQVFFYGPRLGGRLYD
jgi:hypothetical protein